MAFICTHQNLMPETRRYPELTWQYHHHQPDDFVGWLEVFEQIFLRRFFIMLIQFSL
jgi:hypothetical protein